jgi:hypothetical protein
MGFNSAFKGLSSVKAREVTKRGKIKYDETRKRKISWNKNKTCRKNEI